jgi:aspartyl-tRNA(Asn)/glutamyl-tRNA(Gln) amidotransferase subunit A
VTTIAALAATLAGGGTTSLALTGTALDGIARRDPALRCFITLDPDGARRAAAESDARRQAGRVRGPLDGVPVAVKGNIAVAGLPNTVGTRAFPQAAPADATVTARLRAAGAVVFGTLNMHEGALGATTDNPFWGRCQNPLAPGFTPGGSSGGSAAAVAAGFVALALGTDTMGSVRIPAAYCGLWGLKPTRGLIPLTGVVPLSPTLDTVGPIAASAADLSLALAVLAGPDSDDPLSLPLPAGWSARETRSSLAGVTLGVPETGLVVCEAAIAGSFARLLTLVRAAGARLKPVTIAGWNPGALRRAGLLVAEAEAAHLLGPAIAERPYGVSEGFRAALEFGRNASGDRLAAAWLALDRARGATLRALAEVDALLMPTAPQRPFRHDAPTPANQADLTALANAAGLPAVAFPLPAADGGLPASAQLVGPPHADAAMIGLSAALHAAATAAEVA